MRSLGIARYRYLTTLRGVRWDFAMVLIAAAGPVCLFGSLLEPATHWTSSVMLRLHFTAHMVVIVYWLHVLVLVVACITFGARRAQPDGTLASDLTESVPLSGASRYFGDALGILAAGLTIHACTLPILALAVALSPVPTSWFIALELVVIACTILASAAASWKMRGRGRWSATRTARSAILFGILLVLVVKGNTTSPDFGNAWSYFIGQPSPLTWDGIATSVSHPIRLAVCLALLYAAFVTYYAVDSIRSIERS